jgi:hypothetical protein
LIAHWLEDSDPLKWAGTVQFKVKLFPFSQR